MISFEELQRRFGPAVAVAPYGESVVVPGTEFNPDWEAELGDQGFSCHLGYFDGKAVTFVPVKKAVVPGKVVYVPPKPKDPPVAEAPDVQQNRRKGNWTAEEDALLIDLWNQGLSVPAITVKVGEKYPIRKGTATNMRLKRLRLVGKIQPRNKSNHVEVKTMEKTEEKEEKQNRGNNRPRMPWLKDAKFWLPEEDSLIVDAWNKGFSLEKVGAEVHLKIPARTEKAIMKRVYALQKKGKIEGRWKTKGKKHTATTIKSVAKATSSPNGEQVIAEPATVDEKQIEEIASNIEKYVDNCLQEVNQKYRILSEAYDSLNKNYVEFKEDFEAYSKMASEITEAHREELNNLTKKTGVFERELAKHKHAFSGEAVLPMEVS
jgi:hypothetical protein